MKPAWDGSTEADWGGERRRFRLDYGDLGTIESRCGVGIYALLRRMMAGDWRTIDVRQVILLGLERGGCKPGEAVALCRRYLEQWPVTESVPVAIQILNAALFVPEGLAAGKASAGGAMTTTPSPSASSTAQPS